MGYHRAGFDVYGVDLFKDYSQSRYPFLSARGDAIATMEYLLASPHNLIWFESGRGLSLDDFDVIAASPPCQRYSITNAARRADYPDLIGPVRDLLRETGRPYVIENVKGAPLENPLTLCGSMFGLSAVDDDGTPLRMERHRLFESNVLIMAPATCYHPDGVQVAGSYGGARRDKVEARTIRKGGYVPSIPVQQALLGID
jgi:DNA (cytosine-5)-methyltransferase 1